MNYTKQTAYKPADPEQLNDSGPDLFTVLKFAIAMAVMIAIQICVNYIKQINRKKDKEREKKRHEKAERDKLADIINDELDKIEKDGITMKLSIWKQKFEAIVTFYGSVWETGDRKYKITGLDVLRFMLRNPNEFKDDQQLKKLREDLDAVVKLFRSLRVKIPLKEDCPVNIKEVLGPLITDVGEIASSFVPARNRHTIANVLKYFGNGQEDVWSIEDEKKRDGVDDRKMKRFMPYVNRLSPPRVWDEFHKPYLPQYFDDFSDDQEFRFDSFTQRKISQDQNKIVSTFGCMESGIPNMTAKDLKPFADKFDAIWRRKLQQKRDVPIPDWSKKEHLRANIVHAIRVFILKVQGGGDIIQDEEFKKLVGEIENRFSYYNHDDPSAVKMRGQKAIVSIQSAINTLRSDEYAHLCEQKSVVERLERAFEYINCNISSNNE